MTVFTKKAQAKSEAAIGNAKLGIARRGKDQFGLQLSNKDRLDLTKSGAKDLISGTIKGNRIKKGLPPLKRPPAKKAKIKLAKRSK